MNIKIGKKALFTGFTIFCFVLGTQSCKKEEKTEEKVPVAAFTTYLPEYVGGQTIQATNTSTDAKSIRWTLPDGSTSTENQVSFVTDAYKPTTNYTFKLEAFSESKTKTDFMVKNIPVRAANGTIVFYTSNSNYYYEFTYRVDGGSAEAYLEVPKWGSVPSCEPPLITTVQTAGTHTISGTYWDSGNTIPFVKVVLVKANDCTPVYID